MTNYELNKLMHLSRKWLTQYNANHPDKEPKLFIAVHPFLGMIGIPGEHPGLIISPNPEAPAAPPIVIKQDTDNDP